ncbi:hypothetical protein ACIBQX_30235 [Nonomuraea sp. NPDC049714]|uniref:hypothetical protein n=1 Tax=Nonomuraea sp. NPDC049714 TaxID=3364357 RepID=UPI0037A7D154
MLSGGRRWRLSSVAEGRDGASKHQFTIFDVAEYGMFPTTANGRPGTGAVVKPPGLLVTWEDGRSAKA